MNKTYSGQIKVGDNDWRPIHITLTDLMQVVRVVMLDKSDIPPGEYTLAYNPFDIIVEEKENDA